MNSSFFEYIQQIELMAFFSGYPLVYAVILSIAGNRQIKNNIISRAALFMPVAYALVGTLYLGLQLKNLYPDYSFENIKNTIQLPILVTWGLLSVFFWLPAFFKKRSLSLIHSLVIFLLLIRYLLVQLSADAAGKEILRNAMKIYTISILINLGAIILVILFLALFTQSNKHLER